MEAPTPASTLRFPVVLLSKEGGVSVAESPSDLGTVAAGVFWKGKFFHRLRIVDAAGQAHEVVSANVRKPRSAFGRWLARLFDSSVTVQTETRSLGSMSVAEVVHAVEAAIDAEPELFEELSGGAVATAKAELVKCSSVSDVARWLAQWKNDR